MTIEEVGDIVRRSAVAGINTHLSPEIKKRKRSKFNNQVVEMEGMMFDSIRERDRYIILRLKMKAGEIGLLSRQVQFELNPNGSHSLKYIADFTYFIMKTGEYIVEDCKGFRTKEYKKKRRLMKKVHEITILET